MKRKLFIAFLAFEVFLALLLYGSSFVLTKNRESELRKKSTLVKVLELTDLSIWTEARYTRHPTQADFFAAFQDFPSAIEHFPAGSVISPPEYLKRNH